MIRFALGLSLLLAGCAPSPASENEQDVRPVDLASLEAAHDWQHEGGEALNAAWNAGVKDLLGRNSRPEAMRAIQEAGFACTYGEAHADYPDPMAVCTRSFATRSCQMDWEIASTADKGMVDTVDGEFRRDCVGTDDDWPEKIVSAIDDGLAPLQPPH